MHDLLHARSHGHEHAYYKSIIVVLVYGYDNIYSTQMKLCRIDKKHDAHVSCCINKKHKLHLSHQRNVNPWIHPWCIDMSTDMTIGFSYSNVYTYMHICLFFGCGDWHISQCFYGRSIALAKVHLYTQVHFHQFFDSDICFIFWCIFPIYAQT